MLGDERLELGNERELAAERELRVDPLLDRGEPQLLEPLDLDARERLELEVRKRPALPQRSAARKRLRGRGGVTGRERLASLRDEPLEVLEVELARLDAKQVAGGARDEPRLVADGRARAPCEARDVVAQRVVGRVERSARAKSSPISRSRETTRFALSSSSASSARCFGPPMRDGDAVHPNRRAGRGSGTRGGSLP